MLSDRRDSDPRGTSQASIMPHSSPYSAQSRRVTHRRIHLTENAAQFLGGPVLPGRRKMSPHRSRRARTPKRMAAVAAAGTIVLSTALVSLGGGMATASSHREAR